MSPRISTYVLTMDSSRESISHIASFRQNNLIGTPLMSSFEDETGVKLIIIIIIIIIETWQLSNEKQLNLLLTAYHCRQ